MLWHLLLSWSWLYIVVCVHLVYPNFWYYYSLFSIGSNVFYVLTVCCLLLLYFTCFGCEFVRNQLFISCVWCNITIYHAGCPETAQNKRVMLDFFSKILCQWFEQISEWMILPLCLSELVFSQLQQQQTNPWNGVNGADEEVQ